MSYAAASDVMGRVPERDLIQITDPNGVAVDTAVLDQALADASEIIDGYLEGRYTLPFVKAPAALKHLCMDIAMYRMQNLRPAQDIEDALKRHDAALKYLSQVAKGEITLGLADDSTVVPVRDPAVLIAPAPERTFSRTQMDEY